jgi:hypothetical protein
MSEASGTIVSHHGKDKALLTLCNCNGEALMFDFVEWEDKHPYWLAVSIWRLGNSNHIPSIWDRIRWCWLCLRTGQPYRDEILLEWQQIDAIHKFIHEHEEEFKPRNPQ